MQFLLEAHREHLDECSTERNFTKALKSARENAKEVVNNSLNMTGRGKCIVNGKAKRVKNVGKSAKSQLTKEFVDLTSKNVSPSKLKLSDVAHKKMKAIELIQELESTKKVINTKKLLTPKVRLSFVDLLQRAVQFFQADVPDIASEVQMYDQNIATLSKTAHRDAAQQKLDRQKVLGCCTDLARDLCKVRGELQIQEKDAQAQKLIAKITSPAENRKTARRREAQRLDKDHLFVDQLLTPTVHSNFKCLSRVSLRSSQWRFCHGGLDDEATRAEATVEQVTQASSWELKNKTRSRKG